MVTQNRKASETFANEEQAGRITMLPEPSAKLRTLPVRGVRRSHPTKCASISKKTFAKKEKSTRLHSIGTVRASKIMAPRLRAEVPPVNRRMYKLSPVTPAQLTSLAG